MIKITDVVANLIESDELALESLRAGLLNLSAYADKIHSQVENITYKEVQKGTIVVALSRISKNLSDLTPTLKPEVKLSNLSVKSALSAITFEKTPDIQRKVAVLHPFQLTTDDLFAVSEGPSEVTLICHEKSKEKILKHFIVKPKSEFSDLVAITAEFPKEYANTPNIYFVVIGALAAKRINIIEIVSTLNETTFLISKDDLEEAVGALNLYFGKRRKS